MARTKAEIRAFLDSKVGHTCVDQSNSNLNGQCVCLIKNLLDFLGTPSPYAARGNAKDAGDNYIAQGLATSGRGWLTVCVNRTMGYIGGTYYGHIWVDLLNEANYESNGARALVTTKNTRPIAQAQQFINFDKWVIPESSGQMIIQNADNWYGRCNKTHVLIRGRELGREVFNSFVGKEFLAFVEACSDDPEADAVQGWQELGKLATNDNWRQQIYDLQAALKGKVSAEDLAAAKKQAVELQAQVDAATKKAEAAEQKAAALETEKIEAAKTGDLFKLWIGSILNALKGGK